LRYLRGEKRGMEKEVGYKNCGVIESEVKFKKD
jgi:hypothetical protein